MPQRIKIRSPIYNKEIFILTQQGLIAPGMKREVGIEIDTTDMRAGNFETYLTVTSTQHEYKIPVVGYLMNKEETQILGFEGTKSENMFKKETFKLPKLQYKVKELKQKEQSQQIQNTLSGNTVDFETSKNLPKLFYDKNFNLTLTK